MLKQITTTVGETLKVLRLSRGVSQAELGARVGIGQSHIHAIEAGKKDPQAATLVALVQALGYELAVGDPRTIRAADVLSNPSAQGRFE